MAIIISENGKNAKRVDESQFGLEDKVHKVLAKRLKYLTDIFGQVPDTLEDVWTLVAKDEIEKAKKTISEVPPKSPFEEKYENPK